MAERKADLSVARWADHWAGKWAASRAVRLVDWKVGHWVGPKVAASAVNWVVL